jgi:hypothetical protein
MSILQNLGARMKWKYHSHKMKKMPQPLATTTYVQKKPELKVERVGVQ